MLRKNIRSWLTGINDINNCSIQAGDNLADPFSMRMTYQTPDYTETRQYNSNIASLSWRAPLGTCPDIQGYDFIYDGVNRLRGATFWERTYHNGQILRATGELQPQWQPIMNPFAKA